MASIEIYIRSFPNGNNIIGVQLQKNEHIISGKNNLQVAKSMLAKVFQIPTRSRTDQTTKIKSDVQYLKIKIIIIKKTA